MSQATTRMGTETDFKAEPSNGPELAHILKIHRGRDGFVSFHNKGDGESFNNLVSIRVSELENTFPQFREQLTRDAYFSVNSMYRGAWWESYSVTGQRGAYRHGDGARYLNCCFVDLDCHQQGIDFWTAYASVGRLQDWGKIPRYSIVSRSGQGLWVFWLLCDTLKADQPVRAYYHKRLTWVRVQRSICHSFVGLGVDPGCIDVARISRVPGSINTEVDVPVIYYPQQDTNGQVAVYSLEQLQEFFDVPECEVIEPIKANYARPAVKCPNRKKGFTAVNQKLLRDFEMLLAMRGEGFKLHCRKRGALVYASLLLKNGRNLGEIRKLVLRYGSKCKPSLAERECLDAIKGRTNIFRISHDTISDWLLITKQESAMLETLKPAINFWPERPQRVARQIKHKPEQIRKRRQAVLQIVADLGGKIPSLRVMAELLEQRGYMVKKDAIGQDYKNLGLKTEHASQKEIVCLQKSLPIN